MTSPRRLLAFLAAAAVGLLSVVAVRGALSTRSTAPPTPAHAHALPEATPPDPPGPVSDAPHAGPHTEHRGTGNAPTHQDSEIIDVANAICPVMGNEVQPGVHTDYQGLRIHFCCPPCIETFQKDPTPYLKKLGIEDVAAYRRSHEGGER